MYVIGRNDFEFIRIRYTKPMYDGHEIWTEIATIEYNTSLNEATIIPDHNDAKELLKRIKEKCESIKFENADIIGEILDKKHRFDKLKYISELKIYVLLPTEISK